MARRVDEWLDGIDAIATAIYVMLIAAVVGGVLGVVFYVVRHWKPSWGTQGEGFYFAVAVLLVIGWAIGQLGWVIRRRRRSAERADRVPAVMPATAATTWRFSFNRTSPKTFRIDEAALEVVRAARAEGHGWADIARMINPEWDTLPPVEQALYERALEAAAR